MTLEERYQKLCSTPSSINEHLGTLRNYASQCESIAEFGVDIGQSTTAFLMAKPKLLISVDVVQKIELDELIYAADRRFRKAIHRFTNSFGCDFGSTRWAFYLADSRTFPIMPEVDLLFIDSAHCFEQMQVELSCHHAKVRKFIICHDTFSFGEWGEAGPPQVGIVPAIGEFLVAHPEWSEREHFSHNNGLQVLERIND